MEFWEPKWEQVPLYDTCKVPIMVVSLSIKGDCIA